MTAAELERKAAKLRCDVAAMIGAGSAGHLGGSCSLSDVVTVLYYSVMRVDPKRPDWEGRDRFILSKGHAALIQYAALADLGYFDMSAQLPLKSLHSALQGHPDMRKLPGIEANTGSLGQGLSIAAGMAAGLRLDGSDSRVYCCMGDGELAEGQIWEAAMAAGVYRLANLTAVVDENGLQATGAVKDRFDSNPHRDKFEAFGWSVLECDGHSAAALTEAFAAAKAESRRPTVILAKTVKGKGFAFAENNAAFHNGTMTEEQYRSAVGEGAGI